MIRSLRRPVPPLALVRHIAVWLIAAIALFPAAEPARAAERARIEAFLNITGFDVALDSIALTAGDAPMMLGVDPGSFGSEWTRLTAEVFDTGVMRSLALDILEPTLSDAILGHAAAFYATDLGQRLVVAENAAHMATDDEARQAEGERIVSDLVAQGAPRLELFKRMNQAIGSVDSSIKALQEIQIRFMLAASAAGVIELRMDPDELRALLQSQAGAMRMAIRQSALATSAYTYRDFSDDDVARYTEALETPEMKQVYELLNAVQYEIMANRFEVLARRMAGLQPGQDI